jgi:transporter family-2 protein
MSKMVYVFPLLAGFCVCFQGTMNGHWHTKIGVHFTILVNGVVVAILTGVFFLFANQTPIDKITSEVRPWILLNGLCGFTILTIAALTFPKIGAASVIVLMVAAQLATAMAFDHFGILSLPQHPISTARLIGIAFVVVGVFLTTRA